MDASQTISNLEKVSKALSEAANKPENYNTEWAHCLEQMSFSLKCQADELKEISYLFDVSL